MTTTEAKTNNTKWIWMGLGAAALFCLCAIGISAFIFMRVGQQVREGVKTDPEEAAAAAHAIADYELPEGYREQMAMDIMFYTMVMIGPDTVDSSSASTQPLIMLAQFQFGMNQEQMEEQMRQAAEQQAGRRGLAMEVVETKEMTIRGTETEVIIYEGTDQSGIVMRQLITTFPGKGGTAMLMIMGNVQNWDEEEIDTFIESIK